MTYNIDNRKEFVGIVLGNGEVIRYGAAIADIRGQIAERTSNGIYLLNPEQDFAILLINDSQRNTEFGMTGDANSAAMVYDLVIEANTPAPGVLLKRYQTADEGFKAYVRNSWQGNAVGGQDVSEGGGGLITITFRPGMFIDQTSRRRNDSYSRDRRQSYSYTQEAFSMEKTPYVEGVMGSGGATGQQFGAHTDYNRDVAIPELELQLRWAIRLPKPPVGGRIVNRAPSL